MEDNEHNGCAHAGAMDTDSVAPACAPDPVVTTTATDVEQKGWHGNNAAGGAWPALLAQAQANRALAEACRDTATAMLHAMQAQCATCAHAPQSDELECWHSAALDVASVAERLADVAEPDRFCVHTTIATGIGTPPATPRCCRRAVLAARDVALDTPPKAKRGGSRAANGEGVQTAVVDGPMLAGNVQWCNSRLRQMRTLDSDAEACGSPPNGKGGGGPDQNRHTPNGSLAAALSSGKGVRPTTALSKHEPSPVAVHTTKVAKDAAWPSPPVWPSDLPRPPEPAVGCKAGAPIAEPDGQAAGGVAQGPQEEVRRMLSEQM